MTPDTPTAVVPAPADVPTLPPALQRRLRHVASVKALRTRLGAVAGGVLAVASVSTALTIGLPLSAGSVPLGVVAEASPPQSLAVSASAPLSALARDSYSAVAPPALPQLHYPVPLAAGVASGYGPRSCGHCHSTFHHGIDIFPGAGTPVVAMADGVVSQAAPTSSGSMGVSVSIDHVVDGVPVTSLYGHLQEGSMGLRVGDAVASGDLIGRVGATGNAQGAHLHFEIHPGGGGSVNPLPWLAARMG